MSSDLLSIALPVYFVAKQLMFHNDPDFRLLDVGPLKCFHNHPGWPEIDAFYGVNITAPEVISAIRRYKPNPNHALTIFTTSPKAEREIYESLGYKAAGYNQEFMIKALNEADREDQNEVKRVQTLEQYDFINKPDPFIDEAHLIDSLFSYYYIERDGMPICRGRSVATPFSAIYVAGVDTLLAFRRMRFASALTRQMHSDAVKAGNEWSVLCSSPDGVGLYQKLGYGIIATMQAFIPAYLP